MSDLRDPLVTPDDGASQRFGFVAVIGAPNAGKSTLTNQLVGGKVSIVSPKAQTTRARMSGIFTEGASQVVLIDTPGIFRDRRERKAAKLEEAMVRAAWSGSEEADLTLLVIDAARKGLGDDVDMILTALAQRQQADPKHLLLLALNKVDLIAREKLLALTAALNDRLVFAETFMLSALTGDGVAPLRRCLAQSVPAGPWMYDSDQLSQLPERMLAAEVTREKLFLKLHQELPYHLTVETERFEVRKDGSSRIEQVIYVTREQHRAMLLGKGGQRIKEIGALARAELSETYGAPVHLFLFVKVREDWRDDRARLNAMGLEV